MHNRWSRVISLRLSRVNMSVLTQGATSPLDAIPSPPKAYFINVCDQDNDPGIIQAAELLRNGKLVSFPTETVYGLGANALDDSAVRKVFEAKKRPSTDPLIVHISKISQIDELFDFGSEVSIARDIGYILAKAFWPGPLTMICKAKAILPLSVTAGTGFVGLRMPNHTIAQRLIAMADIPIAAPSANRFGHVR
jgi:L-threonylcarbamoyladenylate synthase